MHRVINGTQKGWQTLMAELYREITSPNSVLEEEPMYVEDMEHGKQYEDAARASAELELGRDIIQVGFAKHHQYKWLGASVDGLILNDDNTVWATVEIKVFQSLAHHAYVWTNKRMLDRYIPQVQSQNLVFEAPRSLFVSYHEQMPDPVARLAIVEAAPDLSYHQALIGRAVTFNANFELYRSNGGQLGVQVPTIPQRF